MGLLDSILGGVGGSELDNLGAKVGLSPEQVQSAIQALGEAHPQPGDTATTAAASTGLPLDKLQAIIGHLGGEGALGQLASVLGQPGAEGGGGGIGGMLSGLAGGLFHRS